MNIEVMVTRLTSSLGMDVYKKHIKSAACILDANYDVGLHRLYNACIKSGVNIEVAQYILLSKGMRDDLEISEKDIKSNVKYAYPILMLCNVYYELHDKQFKTKEESLKIIEHKYPEIPITYLTLFKNIV